MSCTAPTGTHTSPGPWFPKPLGSLPLLSLAPALPRPPWAPLPTSDSCPHCTATPSPSWPDRRAPTHVLPASTDASPRPGAHPPPQAPPSRTSLCPRSGASAGQTGPCTSVRASPRASSAGGRGKPLSPAGSVTALTRAARPASSGDRGGGTQRGQCLVPGWRRQVPTPQSPREAVGPPPSLSSGPGRSVHVGGLTRSRAGPLVLWPQGLAEKRLLCGEAAGAPVPREAQGEDGASLIRSRALGFAAESPDSLAPALLHAPPPE